jgi:excisionase family DNA binding protein
MADASAAEVARLNSIEQVQTRLGIGRSMVFELIASGQLRSVLIGRRRLVTETAIAEFIEALEAGG